MSDRKEAKSLFFFPRRSGTALAPLLIELALPTCGLEESSSNQRDSRAKRDTSAKPEGGDRLCQSRKRRAAAAARARSSKERHPSTHHAGPGRLVLLRSLVTVTTRVSSFDRVEENRKAAGRRGQGRMRDRLGRRVGGRRRRRRWAGGVPFCCTAFSLSLP